jgi:hypothetical protein
VQAFANRAFDQMIGIAAPDPSKGLRVGLLSIVLPRLTHSSGISEQILAGITAMNIQVRQPEFDVLVVVPVNLDATVPAQ